MDWVLAGEMTGRQEGSAGLESPRAGAGRSSGGRNFHPTVKPVALMRYLVRLVTPPGGRVVDPFLGSGSTGIAVLMEGAQFIGVELDPEYLTIARRRIVHGIRKPILSENQPVSMQNKIKRYPVLEDQKCS
jgi:site-specific DNA-methyltransferase (adenine-specific)